MDKLDLSARNMLSYGLTMAACLGIISLLIFLKSHHLNFTVGCIILVFLILSLLAPASLKIIYIPWMRIAEAMGFVSSRLILTLVFLMVLTPIGIILRIMGKDLLDRKLGNVPTYWKEPKAGPTDYERQF